MDLSDARFEYDADPLDPASLADDPIVQFGRWLDDAMNSGDPEPYATVLSTVSAEGVPRGRNVLLRGFDPDGFVFFTNHDSAKGRALDTTGVAALTFHWAVLHRQVHVEGTVGRVSPAEADDYFAKRPRSSQLGAWASAQSEPLADRAELLSALAAAEARFEGMEVPRPSFWGGYRVSPREVEFWQGQPSRLHDRMRYRRHDGLWTRTRLNP
ncbi:MAG: pyridoxamine 5'-phosphate oxidase [Acidimicrobiales bacterium]